MRTQLTRLAMGLALATSLLGPLVSSAAEHYDFRGGHFQSHEFLEHEFRDRGFLDNRFSHGHYYPYIGDRFGRLPPHFHSVIFGGVHYFFADAVWYAWDGAAYVVVASPLGIMVPMLPPYYSTVWVAGVPYYYANNTYYAQSSQGYVVVPEPTGPIATSPPANAVAPMGTGVTEHGPVPAAPSQSQVQSQPSGGSAPQTAQLFIYPRQGQSAEQEAKDRSECHSWAVSQTGVDPTVQVDGQALGRLSDYTRAIDACLDARGYTVR
jgi:hypothetical protein